MRRPLLLPLVPLYAVGLGIKNALRRSPQHLTRPVVSVGSLSAGGAGKTPVVLALAHLLRRHALEPDVLSRGYGRGSGAIQQVDPAGLASHFGDEPLEMAQAGFPVFVGANRLAAGRIAEVEGTAWVHLLDDGFQHRRLARTLDLVLLTQQDVLDHLLPAGNLREPFRALERADIVILRDNEAQSLTPFVAHHTQAPVWIIRRQLRLPPDLPSRPLAFCGLARPESFFSMLRASGVEPAGIHAFPDHHPYNPEDIARLCAAAEHARANGFVTSAKDAVKLTPSFRAVLEQVGPVAIAALHVSFLDEPAVWATLSQKVRGA